MAGTSNDNKRFGGNNFSTIYGRYIANGKFDNQITKI